MAKEYTSLKNSFAQHIVDFNTLVNKVGDLTLLGTTADSDLVSAINETLVASGVDSAAINALLDSGQYLKFPALTADSNGDFVLRRTAQSITGAKTFDGVVRINPNLRIGTNIDGGTITVKDVNPNIRFLDSATANNGEITLDASLLRIEVDEDNVVNGSRIAFRIDGTTIAYLDSATAVTTSSLLTKGVANTIYLLDSANSVTSTHITDGSVGTTKIADAAVTGVKIGSSAVTTTKINNLAVTTGKLADDAVDRTKLANEVTLIIYDSTGSAVKTLYGAGS